MKLRLLTAAFVVALFTLAIRPFAAGIEAAPDYAGVAPGPEVIIEIMPGETGSEIAQRLYELGVVNLSSIIRMTISLGRYFVNPRAKSRTLSAELPSSPDRCSGNPM